MCAIAVGATLAGRFIRWGAGRLAAEFVRIARDVKK